MQSTTTVSTVLMLLLLVVGVSANAQTPAAQQDRTLAKTVSDSWITMKVHSLFVPEDALENSDIDVDTRNGIVTLSGTVRTEAGKNRAIEIARMSDGVKSVNSAALRVAAPGTVGTTGQAAKEAAKEGRRAGRTVNDGWIKSKIYAQFLTEDALNDSDIDVDIANGMVTLNGSVRTQAGGARAEAIAKATDGVKGVKNNTKVVAR